jgi:hypothetical protein
LRGALGLLPGCGVAGCGGICRFLGGMLFPGGFLGAQFLRPLGLLGLFLLGAQLLGALLLLRGRARGFGFLLAMLRLTGGLLLLDDLKILIPACPG